MAIQNLDHYDLEAGGDNVHRDVSDIIINMTPSEFVLQMNMGTLPPAEQAYREWPIRKRRDADPNNKIVDGAKYRKPAQKVNDMIGTYHQILSEEIEVSRRSEITNSIGRAGKIGMLIAEAGVSMKEDFEVMAFGDQATVKGTKGTTPTDGVPAQFAGLQTWIKTHVAAGVGATEAALSDGTHGAPTVARTAGTLKALSLDDILEQSRNSDDDGGHHNMLVMNKVNKANWSKFMLDPNAPSPRIATPTQNYDETHATGVSALGSVDIFVGDTMKIDVVYSRHCPDNVVFGLDTSYIKMSYFDGYKTVTVPIDRDAYAEALVVDQAPVIENEAACFAIQDIDATLAMVA